MFYIVERSVVVLKPKQVFLDWINSKIMVSEDNLLDLASIRVDCNSYLIPEVAEIEDGINYVDGVFEDLFQLELASWTEDKSLWPEELSLIMFWEWFDVEISPTLIDLEEGSDDEEKVQVDTIH